MQTVMMVNNIAVTVYNLEHSWVKPLTLLCSRLGLYPSVFSYLSTCSTHCCVVDSLGNRENACVCVKAQMHMLFVGICVFPSHTCANMCANHYLIRAIITQLEVTLKKLPK